MQRRASGPIAEGELAERGGGAGAGAALFAGSLPAPAAEQDNAPRSRRGEHGVLRTAAQLIRHATRSNSLHRRLSWLLLGPLLAVSAISGALAYFVAVDAATRAYDRSLMDPALALAKYMDTSVEPPQLKLPREAIDALRIDAVDRLVFRVSTSNGATVSGTDELAPPPAPGEPVDHLFYDTQLDGVPMRVVALFVPGRAGRLTIQVAETKVKLTALVREVFIGTVVPEALVVLSAVILLWFGIRTGLAPLEKLRSEIKARSPADLHPVAEAGVPQEVRPLVEALNSLLTRLAQTLASQQQFIGNAAHQLRTPLSGCLLYTSPSPRD